jgi:hypothetical protein
VWCMIGVYGGSLRLRSDCAKIAQRRWHSDCTVKFRSDSESILSVATPQRSRNDLAESYTAIYAEIS